MSLVFGTVHLLRAGRSGASMQGRPRDPREDSIRILQPCAGSTLPPTNVSEYSLQSQSKLNVNQWEVLHLNGYFARR